jgi:tetratricopeptide (TPR) repeat protein
MNNKLKMLMVAAAVLAILSGAGCNKLRARDQLNKGVQAYKNAKYEEAITHFQQAVEFDPTLLNARLYLATAYAQQYIPGADTPDNNRMAEDAIDQFKKVLEMRPGRDQQVGSLKGIASLYFNMKKLDMAKQYHQKVAELDPNDPETYYSIGVIDWTEVYQPRMEERAKLGMKPDEHLSAKNKDQKKLCEQLKEKNSAVIQEGIDTLDKAIKLREDYDDAMAYMNLMYRERADIECDDEAARAADLKTADQWVDKAMQAKQARAAKAAAAQGGQITMDQPK